MYVRTARLACTGVPTIGMSIRLRPASYEEVRRRVMAGEYPSINAAIEAAIVKTATPAQR